MIDQARKQKVQLLWDKLADSRASNSDEALEYLLTELTELLNAQHAFWMGTTRLGELDSRDPAGGWRPRALMHQQKTAEREAVVKEHTRRIESGRVDPTIIENLRHAGTFRINIKHEIAPPGWYESEFHDTFYKPHKIVDFIYGVMPISTDVESWIGLERSGDAQSFFGEDDRELLDYVLRPTKWFHHQVMLHHGVWLADEPLRQSERRVLKKLLTPMTEQEIAESLSLSPSTVHTYVVRICRKFGVRGRGGLTALWLGQIPEERK
ncbi:MAG: helix-turn-helix transcriptional regulator [Anaerolineales bacterium]